MFTFLAHYSLFSGVSRQQIDLIQANQARFADLVADGVAQLQGTQVCTSSGGFERSRSEPKSGSVLKSVSLPKQFDEAASEDLFNPPRTISPSRLSSNSSRTTTSDVDLQDKIVLSQGNQAAGAIEVPLTHTPVLTKSSRLSQMLFLQRFSLDHSMNQAIMASKNAGRLSDGFGERAYRYVLNAYREERGTISESAVIQLHKQGYVARWLEWDMLKDEEYKILADTHQKALLRLQSRQSAEGNISSDADLQRTATAVFSQDKKSPHKRRRLPDSLMVVDDIALQAAPIPVPVKRGRGRPKGSKNKPKVAVRVEMDKSLTSSSRAIAEAQPVAHIYTEEDIESLTNALMADSTNEETQGRSSAEQSPVLAEDRIPAKKRSSSRTPPVDLHSESSGHHIDSSDQS